MSRYETRETSRTGVARFTIVDTAAGIDPNTGSEVIVRPSDNPCDRTSLFSRAIATQITAWLNDGAAQGTGVTYAELSRTFTQPGCPNFR